MFNLIYDDEVADWRKLWILPYTRTIILFTDLHSAYLIPSTVI